MAEEEICRRTGELYCQVTDFGANGPIRFLTWPSQYSGSWNNWVVLLFLFSLIWPLPMDRLIGSLVFSAEAKEPLDFGATGLVLFPTRPSQHSGFWNNWVECSLSHFPWIYKWKDKQTCQSSLKNLWTRLTASHWFDSVLWNKFKSWFSNRTGMSVDDCASKSNNWLDQLTNGRAANWAPEVEFSPFRALSRRQMTFTFCC